MDVMKETGLLAACVFAAWTAWAAEPLSPIANPSLYEEQGIAGQVDSATGAISIGGKRYRVNARTVIFLDDGRGNVRRAAKVTDIPPNAPVRFSTGADGSVTQIHVGGGIQPYRP